MSTKKVIVCRDHLQLHFPPVFFSWTCLGKTHVSEERLITAFVNCKATLPYVSWNRLRLSKRIVQELTLFSYTGTQHFGKGLRATPHARLGTQLLSPISHASTCSLDDGLLDLCFIRGKVRPCSCRFARWTCALQATRGELLTIFNQVVH